MIVTSGYSRARSGWRCAHWDCEGSRGVVEDPGFPISRNALILAGIEP